MYAFMIILLIFVYIFLTFVVFCMHMQALCLNYYSIRDQTRLPALLYFYFTFKNCHCVYMNKALEQSVPCDRQWAKEAGRLIFHFSQITTSRSPTMHKYLMWYFANGWLKTHSKHSVESK